MYSAAGDMRSAACLGTFGAIALLSNITQGATGFGSAIVFHFLAALARTGAPELALSPVDTLWVLVGMNTLSGPILMWSTRGDIVWRAALPVFLPGVPGVFVGTFLLASLPTASLRVVLGAAVLLAALWRWGVVVADAAAARLQRARRPPPLGLANSPAVPPPGGAAPVRGCDAGGCELWEAMDAGGGRRGGPPAPVMPPTSVAESPSVNLLQARPPGGAAATPPPAAAVMSRDAPAAAAAAAAAAVAASVSCIPLSSWRYRLGAATAGLTSGVLSGMNGIGGPPIMVFVTVVRMARRTARSTQSLIQTFNTALNIAAMLLVTGRPRGELLPLVGVTCACSLLGLSLGILLNARLTETLNTVVILGILSVSSATLVSSDFVSACGVLAAIALFVGALFRALLWRGRHESMARSVPRES